MYHGSDNSCWVSGAERASDCQHPRVRVYTASGILIVFVLSIVLIPALLTLLPLPQTQDSAGFSLQKRLQPLLLLTQRHYPTVLVASLFVLSLAIWQATTITVDSNFQAFFPETAPVRQDLMRLNRHLVGSSVIYVVIEGHGKDSLKTPAALQQIHTLQKAIDTLPGVDKTISFLDYGELFDRGLRTSATVNDLPVSAEQDVLFWSEPARLRGVMQLAFFNAHALTRVIDHPHYSRTTIQVLSSLLQSSDILTLEERIHAYARTDISEDITVRVTGALVLHASTTRTIVTGQIQSLALAGRTDRTVAHGPLPLHQGRTDLNAAECVSNSCLIWLDGCVWHDPQPEYQCDCCSGAWLSRR